MSFAAALLPEFEQEMASTRSVLERIPDDKFEWQAGPKFHTIGWNANHLAEIPGWMAGTVGSDSWDIAPANGPRYETPKLQTAKEVVALFDKNVAEARSALASLKDEAVGRIWSLAKAGQVMFSMPKGAVIRTFLMNHLIHHRAHLIVYLRLNGVTVPGMYGPGGE